MCVYLDVVVSCGPSCFTGYSSVLEHPISAKSFHDNLRVLILKGQSITGSSIEIIVSLFLNLEELDISRKLTDPCFISLYENRSKLSKLRKHIKFSFYSGAEGCIVYFLKGSDRLCKVVELSMRCCGKFLSDSFETY